MTKALVLFAHPCEESFAASLHRTVVDTLKGRGWQVDDCDLYAEGFNPVLTASERRGYHDTATNQTPVQAHVDRLHAAEALILSFPVWNFGYPAILKGYFDRVFLPGVSFHLADGKVGPALTNIRKLAAVTTYGGTRLRAFLAGDPPRRIVTRSLRFVAQTAPTKYLALYDMNTATEPTRAAFLARVAREMGRF
ncbi:MAG: NAD(P)H dehydrogenase [Rhodobacterales bacterium 17-64-5]|nr:MAG: NAD(P)H dehydrogenase [Rhodobacterales bacterium 17-64-5]